MEELNDLQTINLEDFNVERIVDEDSDLETTDDDETQSMVTFLKNKQKKRKKVGRRSQWSEDVVTDLIDVILNDEKFKKSLIFTNTKNVKNSEIYKKVIEIMKCERNHENFEFDVKQTRDKFKRCMRLCRQASLKIKTDSGIKRFQESKGYGVWFTVVSCGKIYGPLST